ncbi:hypothetical protein GGI43DRAFT_217465 [Trichoderma evansii]
MALQPIPWRDRSQTGANFMCDGIVALPRKAKAKQSKYVASLQGTQGKFSARLVPIPIVTRSLLDRPQLCSVECVGSLRSRGRHTAWDRLVPYARGNTEHLQPLMPRLAIRGHYLGVRDTDKYTEERYSSGKVALRRKIWHDEQSRRGSGWQSVSDLNADRTRRKPYPRHASRLLGLDPSISSDTFLGFGLGCVYFYFLYFPWGPLLPSVPLILILFFLFLIFGLQSTIQCSIYLIYTRCWRYILLFSHPYLVTALLPPPGGAL